MKTNSTSKPPAARREAAIEKSSARNGNGQNGDVEKPLQKLGEKQEKRLQQLEAVIREHGDKFVEVCKALWHIREEELYRKTHSTFEAYCRDRFDFTANYGTRLVRSAEAFSKLEADLKTVPIGTVVLPKTEGQMRELLRAKPKERVKVLQAAAKNSPGQVLTAATIRAAVVKLMPVKSPNSYYTPKSYTTDLDIFLTWLRELKSLAEADDKKELLRQLDKAIADKAVLPKMPEMVLIRAVNEPYGALGNMSAHSVLHKGVTYRTSEALFQVLRFDGHPAIQKQLAACKSPMGVKMIAKKNRRLLENPDSDVDLEIMRQCLRLKWEQHEEIKKLLQSTGRKMIVEDCSARPRGDSFYWGMAEINGQWVGQNWLGKLWMKLRETI